MDSLELLEEKYKTPTYEEFQANLAEFNKLDIKPILLSAIDDYHVDTEKYSFMCHYLRSDETESALKYLIDHSIDHVLAKSSFTLVSHTFCVNYNNIKYGVTYNIHEKAVTDIYIIEK